MTCGIYKIENKINGKVYIGQSINIEERWKQHKRNYSFLTSNFYKAIQEFGINNFNWSIIEECNKKELNEKEKYWINFYDSINNGYNMKIGGSYHKKLTDEQLNFIIEDLIKNENNGTYSFCEGNLKQTNKQKQTGKQTTTATKTKTIQKTHINI